MDLWTLSWWHKQQACQAEMQEKHLQLDYKQGKHCFEIINNSPYHLRKILSCPSHIHIHTIPVFKSKHTESWHSTGVVQIQTTYLCQLTSAGCNDIDDRKSSRRTCITAGNVLGETCLFSAHQFFSNLLSPFSSGNSNISPTLALFAFAPSLCRRLTHKDVPSVGWIPDKHILTCAFGDVSKGALRNH